MQDTDPTPESSQSDWTGWLRLAEVPGVGCVLGARLLAGFGSPAAIFAAPHADLAATCGAQLASAILAPPPPSTLALIERTRIWLATQGKHLLTLHHPAYPPLLREIYDPPLLLYAAGHVELLSAPMLAIVGSRNASRQGEANAQAFARAFSDAGLTIVSGLALGIDAAAHQAALCGSGSTVAVIGTGADIVYPARNHQLAHQIAETGCVVSEYPLGHPVLASNFPRRNRLISGMSRGVLVVEAAAQSGSLITARMAAEQGREVFAIPGSIHAPMSKGCHRLIREGAKLVESAADVLEELAPAVPAARGAGAEPAAELGGRLLAALGHEPVDGDTLALLSGLDAGALSAQLLTMELAGQLERLPGGLFQRVSR
ncbi:DNA-processing protein DprA [Massilia cavernae]|uniref:DNA-protecting protein DprA n=1 Tax=Massilia cavernae TaxID=2320864 RepID=A0A418XS93_9BURK|nr:DNA-processing protein DprA [Massilia cavernae]RJG15417.1 DNA-protecting protein DprA [Massilia cavernae]